MEKTDILFESPRNWHRWLIGAYLSQGFKLWVLEPFHAYHHEKEIRFFPPHLPRYMKCLIKEKKVNLLTANELGARDIYVMAAEKAVEVIEKVYPEYKKAHFSIIKYTCDTLKSSIVENIFKKQLCDRLAVFYSTNIMLNRIEKALSQKPILVYPEINLVSYLYLKRLLVESGQVVFNHKDIRFPLIAYIYGFYEQAKNALISMARLLVQTLLSALLQHRKGISLTSTKGIYKYGISIVSPARQLAGNKRGPDFIVDNKKIYPRDVVYFPLANLNEEQRKKLQELKSDILYPYHKGQTFYNFPKWARLFWISLKGEWLKIMPAVKEAHCALAEYLRWQRAMRQVEIKHFITHCDFGIGHIARNIALKQTGVQTWYFTDSINFGINFSKGEKYNTNRHPFWTYLHYDHFVTWSKAVSDYFASHSYSFRKHYIIGCLWTSFVNGNAKDSFVIRRPHSDRFIITAYDSTYVVNSITSFEEGIVFAGHLLRLSEELPYLLIFFKAKKDEKFHIKANISLGKKLVALYKVMEKRNNIKIYASNYDSEKLIYASDMIVSFPFTSTTFEALSIDKPAVWHDPLGYYKNTLYDKYGVITHSYDELKSSVLERMTAGKQLFKNPFPLNSPLLDPYKDGKAIDRFRDILIAN